MILGVGLVYWVVLEFFIGYYIEKVDVFSFGIFFYVILEWDYIIIDGRKYYGVFKLILGNGKVGFGYVMVYYDWNIRI